MSQCDAFNVSALLNFYSVYVKHFCVPQGTSGNWCYVRTVSKSKSCQLMKKDICCGGPSYVL